VVNVWDAFHAAAAAGPRTSGVLEGVEVRVAVTVLVSVAAGGRHATYAGELHSPDCSTPLTQQSQQGEADAGQSAQLYYAAALLAQNVIAAKASNAARRVGSIFRSQVGWHVLNSFFAGALAAHDSCWCFLQHTWCLPSESHLPTCAWVSLVGNFEQRAVCYRRKGFERM